MLQGSITAPLGGAAYTSRADGGGLPPQDGAGDKHRWARANRTRHRVLKTLGLTDTVCEGSGPCDTSRGAMGRKRSSYDPN